ncbi:MAG: DUF3293 domain-containing protein [Candidatus Accumulibacter sp.]|jgi:hypothetical protein|nr:DUF3293 domain-containing protein [Accumulibacter sp.]
MNFGALETAFRATTYRIETPDQNFDLRIGGRNAQFARFLEISGCREWGVVTAHNPGGRLAEAPDANEVRNTELEREIRRSGRRFYPTRHCADRGDWPVESGFCVLDASLDALRLLAGRFSQLAFVYGGRDACPRLCRAEETA